MPVDSNNTATTTVHALCEAMDERCNTFDGYRAFAHDFKQRYEQWKLYYSIKKLHALLAADPAVNPPTQDQWSLLKPFYDYYLILTKLLTIQLYRIFLLKHDIPIAERLRASESIECLSAALPQLETVLQPYFANDTWIEEKKAFMSARFCLNEIKTQFSTKREAQNQFFLQTQKSIREFYGFDSESAESTVSAAMIALEGFFLREMPDLDEALTLRNQICVYLDALENKTRQPIFYAVVQKKYLFLSQQISVQLNAKATHAKIATEWPQNLATHRYTKRSLKSQFSTAPAAYSGLLQEHLLSVCRQPMEDAAKKIIIENLKSAIQLGIAEKKARRIAYFSCPNPLIHAYVAFETNDTVSGIIFAKEQLFNALRSADVGAICKTLIADLALTPAGYWKRFTSEAHKKAKTFALRELVELMLHASVKVAEKTLKLYKRLLLEDCAVRQDLYDPWSQRNDQTAKKIQALMEGDHGYFGRPTLMTGVNRAQEAPSSASEATVVPQRPTLNSLNETQYAELLRDNRLFQDLLPRLALPEKDPVGMSAATDVDDGQVVQGGEPPSAEDDVPAGSTAAESSQPQPSAMLKCALKVSIQSRKKHPEKPFDSGNQLINAYVAFSEQGLSRKRFLDAFKASSLPIVQQVVAELLIDQMQRPCTLSFTLLLVEICTAAYSSLKRLSETQQKKMRKIYQGAVDQHLRSISEQSVFTLAQILPLARFASVEGIRQLLADEPYAEQFQRSEKSLLWLLNAVDIETRRGILDQIHHPTAATLKPFKDYLATLDATVNCMLSSKVRALPLYSLDTLFTWLKVVHNKTILAVFQDEAYLHFLMQQPDKAEDFIERVLIVVGSLTELTTINRYEHCEKFFIQYKAKMSDQLIARLFPVVAEIARSRTASIASAVSLRSQGSASFQAEANRATPEPVIVLACQREWINSSYPDFSLVSVVPYLATASSEKLKACYLSLLSGIQEVQALLTGWKEKDLIETARERAEAHRQLAMLRDNIQELLRRAVGRIKRHQQGVSLGDVLVDAYLNFSAAKPMEVDEIRSPIWMEDKKIFFDFLKRAGNTASAALLAEAVLQERTPLYLLSESELLLLLRLASSKVFAAFLACESNFFANSSQLLRAIHVQCHAENNKEKLQALVSIFVQTKLKNIDDMVSLLAQLPEDQQELLADENRHLLALRPQLLLAYTQDRDPCKRRVAINLLLRFKPNSLDDASLFALLIDQEADGNLVLAAFHHYRKRFLAAPEMLMRLLVEKGKVDVVTQRALFKIVENDSAGFAFWRKTLSGVLLSYIKRFNRDVFSVRQQDSQINYNVLDCATLLVEFFEADLQHNASAQRKFAGVADFFSFSRQRLLNFCQAMMPQDALNGKSVAFKKVADSTFRPRAAEPSALVDLPQYPTDGTVHDVDKEQYLIRHHQVFESQPDKLLQLVCRIPDENKDARNDLLSRIEQDKVLSGKSFSEALRAAAPTLASTVDYYYFKYYDLCRKDDRKQQAAGFAALLCEFASQTFSGLSDEDEVRVDALRAFILERVKKDPLAFKVLLSSDIVTGQEMLFQEVTFSRWYYQKSLRQGAWLCNVFALFINDEPTFLSLLKKRSLLFRDDANDNPLAELLAKFYVVNNAQLSWDVIKEASEKLMEKFKGNGHVHQALNRINKKTLLQQILKQKGAATSLFSGDVAAMQATHTEVLAAIGDNFELFKVVYSKEHVQAHFLTIVRWLLSAQLSDDQKAYLQGVFAAVPVAAQQVATVYLLEAQRAASELSDTTGLEKVNMLFGPLFCQKKLNGLRSISLGQDVSPDRIAQIVSRLFPAADTTVGSAGVGAAKFLVNPSAVTAHIQII